MIGMILQVGAVPLGYTSEVDSHCCDQCCDKGRRVFFSSTMDWQCLGSDSPLPDLIPGHTPSPSPSSHQPGFHLKPNLDCFPPTPSPTPSGGGCPKCRKPAGKDPEEHLTPETTPDWSPEKVQLKLEHIRSIKQRLEEDVRSHFFCQSYMQRQQSLPQLSWGIPPSRRIIARQQQADQSSEQPQTATAIADRKASQRQDSEARRSIEEDSDRSFEWRLMGEELRLVADTFQVNHASASMTRTSVVLPSALPYAVAASLFFLFSWRIISRWR